MLDDFMRISLILKIVFLQHYLKMLNPWQQPEMNLHGQRLRNLYGM